MESPGIPGRFSMSLRRLEESLRAKVVKRTPKGVELTAVGIALLSRVERLRLSVSDIEREAADISGGRAGHLRTGAATGTPKDILPAPLRALLQDAPKLRLTVTVSANEPLVAALRKGELDVLISTVPNYSSRDFVYERLFEDQFLPFTSLDHPLAKRKRLTIADVARERWILGAPTSAPSRCLHRAFEDNDLAPPDVAMEALSVSLRLRTVSSSPFVGMTSRHALQQASERLRLVGLPIKELMIKRPIGITYRQDAYVSPAARRLIEILKSA
jgi:DNA-binding transcriptional LysR family regulator